MRRPIRGLGGALPELALAAPAIGLSAPELSGGPIGAATHPGPGLGAGSGHLVAQEILRKRKPRR
ncbi:hypothetical protein E3T35_07750 [Cryobacterium sp. TMT1-2-2]|nr:hypothetical protein E3T35_07750 [Cryobacterium sp. TMT1-2-2]